MMHRYCVVLLSFSAMSSSEFTSESDAAGLQRGTVMQSAYVLNLQPPENTDLEVEASLAGIAGAEDEKRQLSDSEFEVAQQRMIRAEKLWIHDAVRDAFVARA